MVNGKERTPRDPLAGSSWSTPETVAGFVQSAPNPVLIRYAAQLRAAGARVLTDVGCGAGRNTVPLAVAGWTTVAADLSWPMLVAARERILTERPSGRVQLCLAPMEWLPVQSTSTDLVIVHGIWNLASTTAQFRQAVREASRIARPDAALFVFTFSRNTLPATAPAVPGERFVFTQFSGRPQCFVTAEQLLEELADAGFAPDPTLPLVELNLPQPGTLRTGGPPVIYQGGFVRTAKPIPN